MIDQAHINLLDLIPTQLKKVASTNGGEYAGACPMCGGKDRFRVQPNAKPNPRWFCRKCSERGGDPVAFLMAYCNLDFKDACRELSIHIDLDKWSKDQKRPPSPTLPYSKEKPTGSDNEHWQERAHKFLAYAEMMMWSDDQTAKQYLNERGFYDRTITQYRLGFNPNNLRDNWGLDKKVWLPAGIVIPYERGEFSDITKIRIRRSEYQPDDQIGKYIPPAGVKNTAYLTRRLLVGDTVIIVESELDAIMLKQELDNPYIVGFATGGTQGAKLLKYLALLALAKRVIVAFDSDESGNKAAKYWLDALPNAVRHVPPQHDINDSVLAGFDLYQWIREVM